ncbi:hypothetical protein EYF80_062552 [Liparis tanakae]|uniref:Uncharacterized protein n=1 Tax=Liparis tanakae TaxID=230148 RepID=A0A4Z2EFQ6_9TELE|nr:hypothetical protein EYF80_062552 [Liparis tanakae]
MKTLCVAAVVVLSLTSACQAASLACEKLLKPVDKGPDVSYTFITELCILQTETQLNPT